MKLFAGLAAILFAFGPASAMAQDAEIADIEALIDSGATTPAAMTASANQVASGDITGSATTLERALISDPDSLELRSIYVATLCDLDDMQAAQFELAKLANAQIPADYLSRIEASCGPITRPVQ